MSHSLMYLSPTSVPFTLHPSTSRVCNVRLIYVGGIQVDPRVSCRLMLGERHARLRSHSVCAIDGQDLLSVVRWHCLAPCSGWCGVVLEFQLVVGLRGPGATLCPIRRRSGGAWAKVVPGEVRGHTGWAPRPPAVRLRIRMRSAIHVMYVGVGVGVGGLALELARPS